MRRLIVKTTVPNAINCNESLPKSMSLLLLKSKINSYPLKLELVYTGGKTIINKIIIVAIVYNLSDEVDNNLSIYIP